MELLFLGTGAGMPSKQRNTTSIVVNLVEERGTYWLIDCGEATQHQLLYTSLKPRRIEKIFITHMHGDHIYGLPGLLGSRSFLGGTEKLTVYGPRGIEEYIRLSLKLSRTHLTYPLEIIEIEPGVVFEDTEFRVLTERLDHVIPCYGFRIEQNDQPGTLLMEKVRELHVPRGPLLGRLKAGEDIVLEDGRVVKSGDVTSQPKPGFTVTVLGDTRFTESSIALAKEADIVVHEATFDETGKKMAQDYGHSTFRQAAQVANEAQAKHLIVTHISARFTNENEPSLLKELNESGCPSFIASDFMHYKLLRDGSIDSFTTSPK